MGNSIKTANLESGLLALQARHAAAPDTEKLEQGLAKLVLTLVQTITEVLERQAVRRMESGRLTSAEVERLGLAFMQIRDRTSDVAAKFGLEGSEFSLKLSSATTAAADGNNRQLTLVDVIDKLIAEGTVIAGDVSLGVAGIDLAKLRLMATLTTE